MSDCANGGRGRWNGVTWNKPNHYDVNDPQPTLTIRIEFDEGRDWEHPLALNGRTVSRVFLGELEYAPVRTCTLVLTYGGTCGNDYECGACGKTFVSWRGAEFCQRCGARVEMVVDKKGRELPHGR